MTGNIEYWRSQLHLADHSLRQWKARAEKAEAELHELTEPISDAGHTVADGLRYERDEWKTRAEKAEAERDEAEQYANKANAALMETTARAEKAEAENQAIKAVALHGTPRLCTKEEWEAKYGDK